MNENATSDQPKSVAKYQLSTPFLFSLFWLSASVLAYEFMLMRLLNLMVWTPFVHLIISLAMLGFGVSGSILWITRKFIQKHKQNFIFAVYLLFFLSTGICWHVSQSIEFNAFMILWDNCTRNCRFCNIKGDLPEKPDIEEPENISRAVKELGVEYVVITSVTRDDLKDKGAGQFLRTVRAIKKNTPEVKVELLVPDLGAEEVFLKEMVFSGAHIVGHNIEMPEKFYSEVRPGADYRRSLRVLKLLKEKSRGIPIKSSIMVGLGEEKEDICRTLEDLRDAGVDIVYIGQYLSPSKDHWPVKRYYGPSDFHFLRKTSKEMGFKVVLSGPMIRSSYRAYEAYLMSTQLMERK